MPQNRVQNILPAPTKKKGRWFAWLWRALLAIVNSYCIVDFTLFQLNIIGNVKSKDTNKEEAISLVEENNVNKKNKKSTIVLNNNQTDSLLLFQMIQLLKMRNQIK